MQNKTLQYWLVCFTGFQVSIHFGEQKDYQKSVKTNNQTNYSCSVITVILTLRVDQSQLILTDSDQWGVATGNCHSATPRPVSVEHKAVISICKQ